MEAAGEALPKIYGQTKKRIFVSFSGGRTSAFMTYWLKRNWPNRDDMVFLFANTGLEDERTLEFVNECDKRWGLNLVWVEAVVNEGRGNGTTHKIVTYESASRRGEPFEDMIRKYGIPNKNFPHCTRELKLRPMTSYIRSIGWKPGSYVTAIGIRADEMDRMDPDADKRGYWYPLVTLGKTKDWIRQWWSQQDFDLKVPEHFGNCITCWKKSERKLLTLVKERPEDFEFMRRMERDYANHGAGEGARCFFRKRMTTEDIFRLAEDPFEPFVEGFPKPADLGEVADIDKPDGCSESCEVHAISDTDMLEEALCANH